MMKFLVAVLFCVLFSTSQLCKVVESKEYIIGGRHAAPGQFPYMVSLRRLNDQHFCGGGIISNRWILSAAHCTVLGHHTPHTFNVFVGAHSLFDGIRHSVANVVNHPQFHREFGFNDICAIQTTQAIQFNDRVKALNLPRENTLERAKTLIAGWGYIAEGERRPNILQYKITDVITNAECRERHAKRAHRIESNKICTLSPSGKGVCNGDSGGPLVSQWREFVGIVSWGIIPCGSQLPDVFTRVYAQLPWIAHITGVHPRPRQMD